jgi:plasmid rolling circle replication initiator protein Rep
MPAAVTATICPSGILTDPLERCSRHRRFSAPLVRLLMAAASTREVGRKIANCARTLDLLMEKPPDGDLYAHLMQANCCRQRVCPWCEWRRSLRWQRRVYEGLEALAVEKPTHRPVLLTLTQKTCEIGELGDRIDEIHKSVNRLTKRKFFPTDLWFRKTEVTFPPRFGRATDAARKDKEEPSSDDILGGRVAHAHVHMLLMNPPSYWGRDYVKSLTWTQEWMTAAKLDYCPVVDVRAITPSASSRLAGNVNLAAALEVGKYLTKSSDFHYLGGDLPEVHYQLRCHRMIGVSAAMRKYIPDAEITDQEMTDEPLRRLSQDSTFERVTAHWNEAAQEYWLAATEGAA